MNRLNQPTDFPESVSYCINPWCQQRQNPENVKFCQACGTSLLINERYRLALPLRGLDEPGNAELFEVEDWGGETADRGTLKVLKVLKPTNHPTLIRLFQQEARVLTQLRHPGIPRVEVDGYFTVSPQDSSQPLHCLVMEKVEGLNLEQWVDENGPISEELVLSWLQQLTEILAVIHKKGLFHRDIKPSNIMLKPDGKLVLIDFGTAREITPTLLEKLEQQSVTRVISKGYTAPEQCQGQAIPKSDLFSLGRTFVYLLTGIYPSEFEDPETGQLMGWQAYATPVSKSLVDLIDQLMAPLSQNRPQSPRVLLKHLADIQTCGTTEIPETDEDSSAETVIFTERISEPDLLETSTKDSYFDGSLFRVDSSLPAQSHEPSIINIEQQKSVIPWIDSKKVRLGVAAALFLGFVGFQMTAPQLAVTFNNRASESFEAGQFDNAKFDIKLALMLDPRLGEAYYIQGLIFDAHQDLNSARTQYEKAMPTLPDKAQNNLGRLDILDGNYATAIRRFEKGLKLVEEVKLKSALHKNLGWALLEVGDYQAAEIQLKQALSLDKNRASTYCLLAQVLEAKGNKRVAGFYWKNCLNYAANEQHLPEVNKWAALARQRLQLPNPMLVQRNSREN